MVYRITGLSSLYDSLFCVALWSNFIGSCLQYSSSLFLNALILIAFTTYNREPILPIGVKFNLADRKNDDIEPFDRETFEAILASATTIRGIRKQ